MNEVSVNWIGENSFATSTGSGHTIILDSMPKQGAISAGPSPMELLLVGLAGCTAVDVVLILKRQRQPVQGLTVNCKGERAQDYPMVYTHITVEYVVQGDVDEDKLKRAIELSEEKYCSASAMLGKTATIESSIRLERDQ